VSILAWLGYLAALSLSIAALLEYVQRKIFEPPRVVIPRCVVVRRK